MIRNLRNRMCMQCFHVLCVCFSLALMQSVRTDAMIAAVALAFVATMSYSDSTAVFKKRFLEVGLTEANFEAFNAEGLNTMGTFAFACNYAPGSADERPLTTLATNILGAAHQPRRWPVSGVFSVRPIPRLLQISVPRLKLQMRLQ